MTKENDDQTTEILCKSCRNDDPFFMQLDSTGVGAICLNCATVCDDICEWDLVLAGLRRRTDSGGPSGPKFTYQRRAYINERLSQSIMEEPTIPEEDLRVIISAYMRYAKQTYFETLRFESGEITKKDIHSVLRSLNRENNTNRWTKLFLEKWKSIKAELLEGKGEPLKYTGQELAIVGRELMRFSAKWDEWQPVTRQTERHTWRFPNRKDIPSINYLVRLIHKKYGLEKYNSDWPLPTTPSALKQLHEFAEEFGLKSRGTKYKQLSLKEISK
jgi:hypothetical protein